MFKTDIYLQYSQTYMLAIFIGVCLALHIGVVFVFQFLFCMFLQCPFLYPCTIFTYLAEKGKTNYSRNS